MPKIIILIPHRGESDYRQWRDWFLLRLQKPPETTWFEMRGLSLTTLRTKLAEDALKSDAEWFFWLDDDIIGPDDGLITLLSHNRPIVCGLYWAKKRKEERSLAAWMKVSSEQYQAPWSKQRSNGYMAIGLEQPSRLMQVDVTGLGFALIHRSVFEGLSKPWFLWNTDSISEDFFFYEKVAAELGIKPTIDMECRLSHIGTFMIEADGSFTTLAL